MNSKFRTLLSINTGLFFIASLASADVFDGTKSIGKWTSPNIFIGDINATPSAASMLIFRVNNGDRAWMNSAGKFGLGYSSPNAKLEVTAATDLAGGGIVLRGSDNVGPIFDAYGTNSAGVRSGVLDLKNAAVTTPRVRLSATGTSYFTGGNVAIGDVVADRPLVVAGQIGIYGPSVGVVFKNTANSNKMWDVTQEAGMLNVNETGVQTVMTWAQGGYVGIGTKIPAYPLQINSANYKALKLLTTNANSDVLMTANPTGV